MNSQRSNGERQLNIFYAISWENKKMRKQLTTFLQNWGIIMMRTGRIFLN